DPNDEEDLRSNQEYMDDLAEEDEEEVSLDDDEMVEVRLLMALLMMKGFLSEMKVPEMVNGIRYSEANIMPNWDTGRILAPETQTNVTGSSVGVSIVLEPDRTDIGTATATVEVLQKSFEELKEARVFEEGKEDNRKQYEEKLKFHALTMKEEMAKEANEKIVKMFAQYTQQLPIPP
ncbi:hypothetical protein Tco_1035814, partial [Tanacetum coccineum]